VLSNNKQVEIKVKSMYLITVKYNKYAN